MTNKPSAIAASANVAPQQKLENSTMRITSKTKVSTGSRRNNISKFNQIIPIYQSRIKIPRYIYNFVLYLIFAVDFKPRNSPSASASPSAPPSIHKSPQSAPA